MEFFIAALACIAGGGVLALLAGRSAPAASWLATLGLAAGSVCGMVPVVSVLSGATTGASLTADWPAPIPGLQISLDIDALSAVFAASILIIPLIAAVYGIEYLRPAGEKRSLGPIWFFYNLLVAALLTVVLARNGILFLIAWEVMSLSSYFLVIFEDDKEEVRQAGFTYLVAMHLGTAFLFVYFVLWGHLHGGSFDWRLDAAHLPPDAGWASLLFLLALVGFGTKAGLMPFHVWLPEAYPAAPSHVPAVMSGVMSKLGIYGILRVISLLGPPQEWWCWALIGIGAASGIVGVSFAMAQDNYKRLLAYSSIENIGIITLGIGLGLLGVHGNFPLITAVGFGGALLHVWNHGLFKSLLFLGAGSVLRATGKRDISDLGGLMKKMPETCCLLMLGSVAICGLPPLNGFASEFLLYYGAFSEEITTRPDHAIPALAAIGSLALIGGIAAVAFTKFVGIGLLGAPRTPEAEHAEESPVIMLLPMALLGLGCVVIGFCSAWVDTLLSPAIQILSGVKDKEGLRNLAEGFTKATDPLVVVNTVAVILVGIVLLLAFFRSRLLANREVGETVTWDCGYADPTVRLQYTGASFVEPATSFFALLLQPKTEIAPTPPEGLFPQPTAFATGAPDIWRSRLYDPAAGWIATGLGYFRVLQHGMLHIYVLYIAATVLLLLLALVWGVLK